MTGYQAGMYRDVGLAAQSLRGIEDKLTLAVREIARLADAQERANELADLVQEVGETPDQ